jgi:hypothetical protein
MNDFFILLFIMLGFAALFYNAWWEDQHRN